MSQSVQRIPLGHRAYALHYEHARIEVRDGTVTAVVADDHRSWWMNVPYANSQYLLLGEGTSITRDAARLLADQSVVVGFTGGGGTPLVSASGGLDQAPVFMEPSDEYRPPGDLRRWARLVLEDEARVEVARALLMARLDWTGELWGRANDRHGFEQTPLNWVSEAKEGAKAREEFRQSSDTTELLAAEARHAKRVFGYMAKKFTMDRFARTPGEPTANKDPIVIDANRLLDHANYLAYGQAAVALHAMGLPFSLACLHGKTRRGGLVFDVADLFKDGITVPAAFLGATEGWTDNQLRAHLITRFQEDRVVSGVIERLRWVMDGCEG